MKQRHSGRHLDRDDRYFNGIWGLSRRIIDRRAGITGRLSGTAQFEADQTWLNYTESGLLSYGSHSGLASQSYRWHILENGQIDVCFKDGRLFHRLDLSEGMAIVDHQCAADHYRGFYRLLGEDRWVASWHVTGPRKDVTLISLFRRHS
jgi:hypothetical protein